MEDVREGPCSLSRLCLQRLLQDDTPQVLEKHLSHEQQLHPLVYIP